MCLSRFSKTHSVEGTCTPSTTMSEESYEVVLSGGGPFGFRLQGGKEFGRGLAIQSVGVVI